MELKGNIFRASLFDFMKQNKERNKINVEMNQSRNKINMEMNQLQIIAKKFKNFNY